MFSIIIPTLWRSKRTLSLLSDLNASKNVDEIIVINNAPQNTPENGLDLDKLFLYTPDCNQYVNPSWNLGVKLAINENIALCNDDINFNANIFSYLKPKDDFLIGLNSDCFYLNQDEPFKLIKTIKRCYGFGCLMFFNKNSYKQIPESLKIWYGDDYLVENIKNIYMLTGLKVKTEMSTSCSNYQYNEIIKRDGLHYEMLKKDKSLCIV